MGARHRRCRQHPVAWVKGAGGSDSSTPGTGTVSSLGAHAAAPFASGCFDYAACSTHRPFRCNGI